VIGSLLLDRLAPIKFLDILQIHYSEAFESISYFVTGDCGIFHDLLKLLIFPFLVVTELLESAKLRLDVNALVVFEIRHVVWLFGAFGFHFVSKCTMIVRQDVFFPLHYHLA